MKRIIIFTILVCYYVVMMIALANAETVDQKTDTIDIILHNDTEFRKIYWFKWLNHPFGCRTSINGIKCDFNLAVGEINIEQKVTLSGGTVGNKYCIEWDNVIYHKRVEGSKTKQCFEIFEITKNIKQINITPSSIVIEKKKYPVTIKNCTIDTWIGIVRWLNNKTDYEDVPDVELKKIGSKTFMLPEGEYAITHFKPPISFNGSFVSVAAILEFRELVVDGPENWEFGNCIDLMIDSM